VLVDQLDTLQQVARPSLEDGQRLHRQSDLATGDQEQAHDRTG